MKFKNIFFYAVVILLILFISNIFISTGYFRTIENKFDGKIVKKINIIGAEDITISRKDSFAIVSSTARNKRQNIEQEFGGLYLVDLKNDYFKLHI